MSTKDDKKILLSAIPVNPYNLGRTKKKKEKKKNNNKKAILKAVTERQTFLYCHGATAMTITACMRSLSRSVSCCPVYSLTIQTLIRKNTFNRLFT